MKTLFLLITILLTNDGVFAANTPLVIYRIPLDFCGGRTTLVKSRMVSLDNSNDYSEADAIDYNEFEILVFAKKRWPFQQIIITGIELAFVVYDTDKQQKRYFVACGNRLIDFSNMVEYHFKTPDSQKLLKAFIENNID